LPEATIFVQNNFIPPERKLEKSEHTNLRQIYQAFLPGMNIVFVTSSEIIFCVRGCREKDMSL
jgi:hypothetical protein